MDNVAKAGEARATARVFLHAALTAVVSLLLPATSSAQMFSQAPEAAAKVVELNGQVSVLKDSQPWALNIGDSIQVKQVIITGADGYAKFQVSDGSTFEVYPNSNVTFRNNPGRWQDLLDVWVGKIKVHIQKLGGQPNPNTIHTPSAIISVRGTIFDVEVDGDEENTVVTVEEGAVEVRHATRGGSPKIINAGDSIIVYKSQPLAQSLVDKGAIARRILRAMYDAVYTMQTTGRGGIESTGSSPGTGGLSGQTPPKAPPPAPPPPPPPPGPG
jgi:hypothetical protein